MGPRQPKCFMRFNGLIWTTTRGVQKSVARTDSVRFLQSLTSTKLSAVCPFVYYRTCFLFFPNDPNLRSKPPESDNAHSLNSTKHTDKPQSHENCKQLNDNKVLPKRSPMLIRKTWMTFAITNINLHRKSCIWTFHVSSSMLTITQVNTS